MLRLVLTAAFFLAIVVLFVLCAAYPSIVGALIAAGIVSMVVFACYVVADMVAEDLEFRRNHRYD